MIRQGVGNLINCYIDDSTHQTAADANPIFKQIGPYKLSRCLNSRNGACIAADTCVFNGIEEPIIGAEVQGDDTGNMTAVWATMFKDVYNHTLIVNSTVTNSKGTYTGSSWDNNGENLFTTGFKYRDKSTVGKWAWASHIVNESSYEKRDYTIEEAKPMEFTYDTDGTLPFEYQVLPLEDVKEVVTGNSGAGVIEMTNAEWLQTDYLADSVKIGDVDGDGDRDSTDAVFLKKYLAGIRDFNVTINEKACDVNGDGDINVRDAILLLKHLAQMIDIDALYG